MRAIDAIGITDEMTPNSYDLKCKLKWLEQLEKKIWHEVLTTHEGNPAEEEPTITTGDEPLLIAGADENLYQRYLEMQIAYANDEAAQYENAAMLFAAAYSDWANRYNRSHLPIPRAVKLTF